MHMPAFLARRTVMVSGGCSAASGRAARKTQAAPANESVVRNRRRVWIIGIRRYIPSRLQLAFELVEEPEVGALGEDLLRARFDEAEIVQPQCVKPHAVLGAVVPPAAIGVLVQGL